MSRAWRRAQRLSTPSSEPSPRLCATVALAVVAGLIAVPVVSLVLDVPARGVAVVALALAGIGASRIGRGTELACAALFVTIGFNATAYLAVPGLGEFQPRVGILLAIPVLWFLVGNRGLDRRWLRRADSALVVGAFGAFVGWTALATVVGNGPSTLMAVQYLVDQASYLLLLLTAAVVTAETDWRLVAAPLLVGIGGSLAFAVEAVFAGDAGYLVDFGRVGLALGRAWPSPGLAAAVAGSAPLYRGPGLGLSRAVVGLAIAFVPFALAAGVHYRRPLLAGGVSLLGVVPVVASTTHAGIAGLYAAVAVVLGHTSLLGVERFGTARMRRLALPMLLGAAALAVAGTVLAVLSGADSVLFVRTNNLDVRLDQYVGALDIVARYPLFGVGGGRNHQVLLGTEIHNLLLATMAGTGIPGALAHLSAFLGTCWCCLERLSDRPRSERWFWVGLLGALGGLAAYAAWTVAYRWVPVNAVLWTLAGVAAGTAGETALPGLVRERARATVAAVRGLGGPG